MSVFGEIVFRPWYVDVLRPKRACGVVFFRYLQPARWSQQNRSKKLRDSVSEVPQSMFLLGFYGALPHFLGEPHRTRTYNPLIKSQLLYQLS